MNKKEIEDNNYLLLSKLSIFLNNNPDYINEKMINDIKKYNYSNEETIRILLTSILGFDDNNEIKKYYINNMIKELDVKVYKNNLYYKNIKLNNIKEKKWKLQIMKYKPYELFVFNDFDYYLDNRVIPQIGFFSSTYEYPCILENNREWMMITPNEIETMKKPIENAFGDVLTYGLGLGYYAYMCSLKDNVKSITIIERDKDVIDLFTKYILPQFNHKDKIKIIECDAYEYACKKNKYDYVFVDIWHDPSDGVDAYIKFKKLENKNTIYSYWIENTIRYYL